jgi:hypothetical protein
MKCLLWALAALLVLSGAVFFVNDRPSSLADLDRPGV